jgi:hypothetical protein
MSFVNRNVHRPAHNAELQLTVTRSKAGLSFVPAAVPPPEPGLVVTPTENDGDGETSQRDDDKS